MEKLDLAELSGTCLSPSHNPEFVAKMNEITEGISKLEPLASDMVFYVDGDNGDDINNGLTLATAFKTFDFLWSGGVSPLPREINADVTVYCKGTILSVSTVSNLNLNNFYGTGSLTIKGEWIDLQTDIVATAWDNDQLSVTKKCFIEATAESWTVDEFKGKFILITSGTGAGDTYTPIMSNTSTRLETQDLNLLDGTTRFSIVEATKVRAALVSDPTTRIEYDAPYYVAFLIEGVGIDVTITTLDFTEIAVPTGYNNNCYLGGNNIYQPTANTAYILLENISMITYSIAMNVQKSNLIRCALFIDIAFTIWQGLVCAQNSILAGLGDESNGFLLTNPQTRLTLNGTRITGHLHGVSQIPGVQNGSVLQLNVRNLFENCITAIDTINAKVLIGLVSASYPECFLNCTTALKLAGNSYAIGKNQQFNVSGVLVEMEVDSIQTIPFVDITANKVVNNNSGGSVIYYDSIVKETYTPPRVDIRVMSPLDVSNPPTATELTGAFDTPSVVGAGFTVCIDDSGAGTNVYTCTSDGTNWWVFTGVKAL